MNREEAIDKLQDLWNEVYNEDSDGYDYAVAIDMAIEALQGDMYCPNCGVRLVPENEYLEPTHTHGRLIDADALKKKAQECATEAWKMNLTARIETVLNQFIDWIDNAPTVEDDRPHGEWTPVTEQLPKIDETLPLCDQISDEVLGTDTYGNIRHVYLTNCGYLKPTFCTVEEGMSVDIVAWMPTPEPYEEVIDGKTKNTV